jgi:D-aspartate ligase
LSVARSLAGRGVRVVAFGTPSDPVRRSRHCAEFESFSEGDLQSAWYDRLMRGPRSGAVLFPCCDDGLELIATNRAAFEDAGYRLLESRDDVTLAMLDKQRTYELARGLGIPTPRTLPLPAGVDPGELVEELGLPCGVKPLHAHVFARHIRGKLIVVSSLDELRAVASETRRLGIETLLTEMIPGPQHLYRSAYTYLDADGAPLLQIQKQSLRQYPANGGTTFHVAIRDPEVAELGLRFFQGVGLRGICNVEFKRDPRDDRLRLIECNARVTAANELLRQAGIDIAALAYERALGRPGPITNGYRAGLTMWLPLEDSAAFVQGRRRGELTFAQWARTLPRRHVWPVFRWDDPAPSAAALARLPVRVVQRMRAR